MNGTLTENQGQSEAKTEEELFKEISSSLRNGEDIDKVMSQELVETPDVPVEKPEPAAPVSEEVTPKPEDTTTAVVTPAAPVQAVEKDWTADLPAEVQERVNALKQANAQLEHRVKSELGRVPALQRKVEELNRRLQTPVPKVPAAKEASKANEKFQEAVARIQDVDPLLADALVALKEDVSQPLREEQETKISHIESRLQEKEDEELWKQENQKLLTAVPQAHEVFQLPVYQQWKAVQTDAVRELATSIYADDVLVAFEKFARDMQRTQPQVVAPAQIAAAPVASPVAPVTVTDQTNKVLEERNRKLAATTPTSKSQPARTVDGLPEDPDAMFAYFAEKIRKGEM